MNWTRINWALGIFLFAVFLASLIPVKPVYFGFLPLDNAKAGLAFIVVFFLRLLLNFVVSEIARYEPPTALHAKRFNEQIKLTAISINTLALATVSIISLSELVDSRPDYTVMVLFGAIAAWIHVVARNVLEHLKDETPHSPANSA